MRTFYRDGSGVSNMLGMSIGGVVVAIIALMVFGTLTAGVMPTALSSMNNTTLLNETGGSWDDDLTSLWDLTPILTGVALLAIPTAIVIKVLR